MSETEPNTRRSRISLGEMIALGALIVSALGVWIAWKSSNQPVETRPTNVVERRAAIPLTLRGTPASDGSELTIAPVEPTHALESLTLTIEGAQPIELSSDGKLSASQLEAALKDRDENKGAHSVNVRIAARYVEAGVDRRGGGPYVLRYRWESGGLFGGRTIRLSGLTRG
jgi:hypothetical protein